MSIPANVVAYPTSRGAYVTWTDEGVNTGKIYVVEAVEDSTKTVETSYYYLGATITGLTNGTAYTFRVRDKNFPDAWSQASASVTPTDSSDGFLTEVRSISNALINTNTSTAANGGGGLTPGKILAVDSLGNYYIAGYVNASTTSLTVYLSGPEGHGVSRRFGSTRCRLAGPCGV